MLEVHSLGSRTYTYGLAAILFITGVVSRLPFRSSVLHHWDSVNFALALEHFDVRLHQPHPPGTFVIYLWFAKLIDWFLHDPNASLVWVSVLSSGLAAASIFLLARHWFGERAGISAALLLLSSPLIWFHGEIALSYMPEACLVLVLVLLCSRQQAGSETALLASALLMGLAGGVRPNTPVFLSPLWLFSAHRFPRRKIAIALAVMAGAVALWAVPMILSSGGLVAYWEVMRWWRGSHLAESSKLASVAVNTARLGMFTAFCIGAGFVPVLWAAYRYRQELKLLPRILLADRRGQTLALWVLPATAYFVFVHLRQPGHTFTIMPALIIVAALAIATVARDRVNGAAHIWIAVVLLVILGNSLLFWFGPPRLFGSSRSIFSTPTWTTIKEYDADITRRLEAIRRAFRPEETVVLAGSRNFRLPDFYLRDFQLTSLSYQLGEEIVTLPEHMHTLVLFDDSVLAQLQADLHLQVLPLPEGTSIRYLTWDESQYVQLTQNSLDICPHYAAKRGRQQIEREEELCNQ